MTAASNIGYGHKKSEIDEVTGATSTGRVNNWACLSNRIAVMMLLPQFPLHKNLSLFEFRSDLSPLEPQQVSSLHQ
ncbi:hypothetical protein [Prochlorothrix hollandica]|uniref:Uncharacterized protein n=1 Tax=Prochlorothrix hollandica PCC 9006 = CALU 1027 TaxID=317619 RepID=A0A0M2Q3M0_PROHO|nr:hypothetical protein [Prochlorothrix hollandica]KKJ01197.1 hypothetical protein PROH_02075 [Prochlorothrix hollandica PCC 9006 = CALU 1027]